MSDLLTVSEVAALLNCSEESVTRRFAKAKGVIDLGSPETSKKRRYRVLRIPKSVVEKYVLSKGGRISIPQTSSETRGRKQTKAVSEDDLTRDLAALASQSGDAARKTLERIASRAKAMTYVPSEEWEDMVFFPDEG
jgi:hypothetical protein